LRGVEVDQVCLVQLFPFAVPVPLVNFHAWNEEPVAELFNLLVAPVGILLEAQLQDGDVLNSEDSTLLPLLLLHRL